MEKNFDRKIAYINGEWSQSLANANNKIADLIMELEAKDEEIKDLKSELNRTEGSKK